MSGIADTFSRSDVYRRQPSDPARITIVTAPGVELYTSADAIVQQALKLDSVPSDAVYVSQVLAAARRYFERATGLALITRALKATFDRIPGDVGNPRCNVVSLARAPLILLTAVNYIDVNGASQSANLTDYAPGNTGSHVAFGTVRLKETASWPTLGTDPGALSFTFTAGFGTAATNVPEEARMAVLQLAAHWYQNRLPVSTVRGGALQLPMHLDSLIEMCRVSDLA